MKERPILFRAPMVRALLDGSKTQTRRAFNDCTKFAFECAAKIGEVSHFLDQPELGKNDLGYVLDFCPYGKPGDQLWVRETWQCLLEAHNCKVGYAATPDNWKNIDLEMLTQEQDAQAWHWAKKIGYAPSIHMPRWASRIQLEITAVRVERLNDISEADAKAEGMKFTDYGLTCFHQGRAQDVGACPAPDEHHQKRPGWHYDKSTHQDQCWHTAKYAFGALWESISGAGSWAANPWVWVVEFKRV